MTFHQYDSWDILSQTLYEDHRDWANRLMSYCQKDDQGNLIVPVHIVEQWEFYSRKGYSDLTEVEIEDAKTRAHRIGAHFEKILDEDYDQTVSKLRQLKAEIADLEAHKRAAGDA